MIEKISRPKSRIFIVLCIFFVTLVTVRGILQLSDGCPSGDICELAGQKIRVEGEIVSLKSERLEKTIIEVETSKGKILVILPHTQYELQYGDKLILEGKLKLPARNSEDNFSYPLYLKGKGIYSMMDYPEILAGQKGEYQGNRLDKFYKNILDFREKVREILNYYLVNPGSAVVGAMIIGDQGGVPQELRQKLSKTGIIHILSVSGAHVTLIIAMTAFLLSFFTCRRFVIFLVVSAGVIFYLLLAGSPNCASRSAIMGLLVYLAFYRGENPNLKTALWFSALALLSLNPLAIFSDVGFELSFLAVIGMIYVFPLLDKSLTWGRAGLQWKALRVLLLSISISLTTTPLVYYYFGIVSWISPVANLILIPLFSLILPMGFLVVVIGLVSQAFSSLGVIAEMIAVLIQFILYIAEHAADIFLKIPGSYSEGSVKPGWIILYYILLFLGVLFFYFVVKRYIFPRRLKYFESEEFLNKVGTQRAVFLRRKIKKYRNIFEDMPSKILLFYCASVCCLLFFSLDYLYSSSRSPRLIMLNVGQGDAFLLDWPRYHLQILIDGGPGRNILSELGDALPFYDRKIEMLILSHPHQDHIEGLISVVERYKVAQAVLNSLPPNNNAEMFSLPGIFWKQLIDKKIPISISKKGQKIFFNSNEKKTAELEFLSPFFDYSKNIIANINDQSAIAKMNYPREVLFMGDSSSKMERILLSKESHNLKCEILKIGHHGSRFSTSNEFLDAVQAKTALISAGKSNLFGHPAQATIKKLDEKKIKIYRTDINGHNILDL